MVKDTTSGGGEAGGAQPVVVSGAPPRRAAADFNPWRQAVAYDRAAIERQARAILDEEFYWTDFLRGSGVAVLRLDYEAVAADVDGVAGRIAGALGLAVNPPTGSAGAIKKQRSQTAGEWRERFAAEARGFLAFWEKNRGLMTASPPE